MPARGVECRLRLGLDERAKRLAVSASFSRKVGKRLGTRRRKLAGKLPRSLKAGSSRVRIKLPGLLRRRGARPRVKLKLKLADDLGDRSTKTFSVRLRR